MTAKYLLNGFLLIIPALLWNILLVKFLPEGYSGKIFDRNVPSWLLIFENILRFMVMILPLFMPVGLDTFLRRIGLAIYLTGILLYFASWLVQILFPKSCWSLSKAGFLAPAYTPAIWLTGIGLLTGSFLMFESLWISVIYIVLSFVFVSAHFVHTGIAYKNNQQACRLIRI